MSIQELEDKHKDVVLNPLNYKHYNHIEHTKLSIEFAISVLDELKFRHDLMSDFSSKTFGYKFMCDKIQELKTYLDESI